MSPPPPQYSTVQLVPYVDIIYTYCIYCTTKKYNTVLINISKSVFLFVCLSVCMSGCLSFCLPTGLPACLYICLKVANLPVCLSLCLSLYILDFLCLSVQLSVSLSACVSPCLPSSLPSQQTDRGQCKSAGTGWKTGRCTEKKDQYFHLLYVYIHTVLYIRQTCRQTDRQDRQKKMTYRSTNLQTDNIWVLSKKIRSKFAILRKLVCRWFRFAQLANGKKSRP